MPVVCAQFCLPVSSKKPQPRLKVTEWCETKCGAAFEKYSRVSTNSQGSLNRPSVHSCAHLNNKKKSTCIVQLIDLINSHWSRDSFKPIILIFCCLLYFYFIFAQSLREQSKPLTTSSTWLWASITVRDSVDVLIADGRARPLFRMKNCADYQLPTAWAMVPMMPMRIYLPGDQKGGFFNNISRSRLLPTLNFFFYKRDI